MVKMTMFLFFIVIIFAGFSCSEDTPLEPAPTPTGLSTLSAIQQQVFNGSCATAGCHAGANPAAGLNLTAGNSHSQLVNVQSVSLFTDKLRVQPNNSANSSLMLVLRSSDVNVRMPLGGTALSTAIIDSIAKWIDSGALNN